jgi:hypothetical protein
MRAYITESYSKSITLQQETIEKSAYVPIRSILSGNTVPIKSGQMAKSIQVPDLLPGTNYSFKSLNSYNIYRSDFQGGPYSYIDNTTNLYYTDNMVSNGQLYSYMITATYSEGESDYSNISSAYPQEVVSIPFFNNFDNNNGNFYGTGDWQWGVPAYVNGPAAGNSPPNVWGTNLTGDYSSPSYSWLVMPFDLSGSAIYTLSFANWFDIESGVDFGYLAIDPENDGIFDILEIYTGSAGGWITEELIIDPSYSSSYCKIAFVLQSDNSVSDAGFYIDDFDLKRHINLELKVFLEGPFNSTDMDTWINSILPLEQPYDALPWNYTGTESVVDIPSTDIVDWIFIELRDAPDAASATPATMIAQQAAFLKNDGSIVGLDGISNLQFDNLINDQLFVVLQHRNHLGIMSADPVPGIDGQYIYNFSTSNLHVYGGSDGYVEIVPGVWGMVSGDADANGVIELNDKSVNWSLQAGEQGYQATDLNMDGQTDNPDKNESWLSNIGKESQVPK